MEESAAEAEAPSAEPAAADAVQPLADEMPGMQDDGFEEARPQLEQQLIQQKQNEVLNTHLAQLYDDAEVETDMDALWAGEEEAVIAWVNGEEIPMLDLLMLEYQEMQQMIMMGLDPEGEEAYRIVQEIRPHILDHLISTMLIRQQAEALGLAASEEDIDQQYQMFVQQFGGEDILNEQLEQAGMTAEDLRKDIADQFPIQAYVESYLAEHISPEDLVFTEEELRSLYHMQQMQ